MLGDLGIDSLSLRTMGMARLYIDRGLEEQASAPTRLTFVYYEVSMPCSTLLGPHSRICELDGPNGRVKRPSVS